MRIFYGYMRIFYDYVRIFDQNVNLCKLIKYSSAEPLSVMNTDAVVFYDMNISCPGHFFTELLSLTEH